MSLSQRQINYVNKIIGTAQKCLPWRKKKKNWEEHVQEDASQLSRR